MQGIEQPVVFPGGQRRRYGQYRRVGSLEGVGDTDGKPYNVQGEYVEVDPPRVVSYTWIASWSGPMQTLVRWELEAADGGMLVRLRHSGFGEASAAVRGHYDSWIKVIGWMQAFVEKGETVANRAA